MHFSFDWDPAKERVNIRKHGVSFQRALTVFRDPNHISVYDEKHSELEERWITIGVDMQGILRVIVHTISELEEESCKIRIISARKATRAETNQYYAMNQ